MRGGAQQGPARQALQGEQHPGRDGPAAHGRRLAPRQAPRRTLHTLRGELLPSNFKLPQVSVHEILDLLPRLRTELPDGPEVPRMPVLGDTWRHDEDVLLVMAHLLDADRVRARAAELPTPLALPFVAARFGASIGADEGRAILRLLGEAIGARGSSNQLRRGITSSQPRPSKPWVWAYAATSDDFLRDALEVVLTSTGKRSPGFDHMVVQGISNARPRVMPMITAIFPRVKDDAKVLAALKQALNGLEQNALGI